MNELIRVAATFTIQLIDYTMMHKVIEKDKNCKTKDGKETM